MPDKLRLFLLSLLATFVVSLNAHALSNDVKLDIATNKLSEALEVEDDGQILEAISDIRELIEVGFIEPDIRLDFFEGNSLYKQKKYLQSKPLIERYVNSEGRNGDYYSEAINILSKIDKQIETQVSWELQKLKEFHKLKSRPAAEERLQQLEALAQYDASAYQLLGDAWFQGIAGSGWDRNTPKLIPPDAAKARDYYERLYHQMKEVLSLDGYRRLAYMYYFGVGGSQKIDQALILFEEIVQLDRNDYPAKVAKSNAKNTLFSTYAFGEMGVSPDLNKAQAYANESELNHLNIGRLYLTGTGRPKDTKRAIEHFERFKTDIHGIPHVPFINSELRYFIGETWIEKADDVLGTSLGKRQARYYWILQNAGLFHDEKRMYTGASTKKEFGNFLLQAGLPPYSANPLEVYSWNLAKPIISKAAYQQAKREEYEKGEDDALFYYQLALNAGHSEAGKEIQRIKTRRETANAKKALLGPTTEFEYYFSADMKGTITTADYLSGKSHFAAGVQRKNKYRLLIKDNRGSKRDVERKIKGRPTQVSYSPSGKWLASASSYKGRVRITLWDVNDDYDDIEYIDIKDSGDAIFLQFLPDENALIIVTTNRVESYTVPELKRNWGINSKNKFSNPKLSHDGSRLLFFSISRSSSYSEQIYRQTSALLNCIGTAKGRSKAFLSGSKYKFTQADFIGASNNIATLGERFSIFGEDGGLLSTMKAEIPRNSKGKKLEVKEIYDLISSPAGDWVMSVVKTRCCGPYNFFYDLESAGIINHQYRSMYGNFKISGDRKRLVSWRDTKVDLRKLKTEVTIQPILPRSVISGLIHFIKSGLLP